MPTNDERRRLADNMRVFDVVSDAHGRYWLNGTLFGMDITTRSEEDLRNGMKRLASFIDQGEPAPTSSDSTPTCIPGECPINVSHDNDRIDRDALLALADEMEKWSLTCDHYDRQVLPLDVTKCARRIREAVEA